MKNYQTYLKRLRKSQRTIEAYSIHIEKPQKWCTSKRMEMETINYRQLLRYIATLKENNQANTVNNHLTAIRHYLNDSIERGCRTENIAEGMTIRGGTKKVLQNLLSSDELEDLYYSYETNTHKKSNFYFEATAKRNCWSVGVSRTGKQ